MPTPTDLQAAMRSRARPEAEPAEALPAAPGPNRQRPGRRGKSNVTGYFAPAVKRQLRMLAAESDTTIQALLGEALNDLFAKHGKPEIVEVQE